MDFNEPVPELRWMRWVCVAQRTTPAGTSEDRVQFKTDLVNITGGAVDSSWTSTDFNVVKAAFDTYLTVLQGRCADTHTFVQYRAYEMSFNPEDPGPGERSQANGYAFAQTGPPRYVLDFTKACAGGNLMPYQVAQTVTLRTGWARHWGRMYLPTPNSGGLTAQGRLGSSATVQLANATKALGGTLADNEFHIVVPVTDVNKAAFHGLLGVNQYVVDDVLDVQRRRRPKQAAVRSIGT